MNDKLKEPGEVFDEKVRILTALQNDGIEATIERAIKQVDFKGGAVAFNFNGVPVIVNKYSDKDIVLSYYFNQLSFMEYLEEIRKEELEDVGTSIIQNNKINNVPEWKDTNYNVGAMVKYDDIIYLVILKVKKGDGTPPTTPDKYLLIEDEKPVDPGEPGNNGGTGGTGTTTCPPYDSKKKYQIDECCSENEKDYLSLVANNNNPPSARPQDWKLKPV